MRQPLVAGNWKMHGTREGTSRLLADILAGLEAGMPCETVVCPPYVYLADAARILRGTAIKLGAQNVCAEESGAFTGEIAASMLADTECAYVIAGHSERRHLYGETDALVARKFMAADRAGLHPILCVGETLEERERGATAEIVSTQLRAVLDAAGVTAFGRAVVAYEPVWAIGTGRTASPDQAQEVHRLIRDIVHAEDAKIANGLRVLYGGSVKAANAAELFGMPDVDGGLVGGASLDAGEFVRICLAVRPTG